MIKIRHDLGSNAAVVSAAAAADEDEEDEEQEEEDELNFKNPWWSLYARNSRASVRGNNEVHDIWKQLKDLCTFPTGLISFLC